MTLASEIEGFIPQAVPMLAGLLKRVIPILPLDAGKQAALTDAVDQIVAMAATGEKLAADIEAILAGATAPAAQ